MPAFTAGMKETDLIKSYRVLHNLQPFRVVLKSAFQFIVTISLVIFVPCLRFDYLKDIGICNALIYNKTCQQTGKEIIPVAVKQVRE